MTYSRYRSTLRSRMLFSIYGDKILLGSKGHKVPFVFLFDVIEDHWARLLQYHSTGCVIVLSLKATALCMTTV